MQLQELNKVLGVELKIMGDNLFSCRWCLVTKEKSTLLIEQQKTLEGNLSDVLAALPKSYPSALTLTGKGIIHKNILLTEELSTAQLFQRTFPAIEQQNFYVQQYGEQQVSLNIMRKEVVDDLLAKVKPAGLKVFTLSLGAIIAAPILAQLNIYGNQIIFDGHIFDLGSANELISYKFDAANKSRFPVKVAEEAIAESNIVAYAAAFQLLLYEKLTLIHADVTYIDQNFTDYIANSKLKKKVLIFLFMLFAALMVSFSLFSYYHNQNAQLMQTVGAQSITAEQTDRMRKNIIENEQLLKQLSWNGGYNYGFLVNEIGRSMPKQINLLALTINEFKTEAEKAAHTPQLKLLGTTDNLMAVNNWMFVLKEKPWVKTVNLLQYQEDAETDQYRFNLIVTY